MHTCEHIINQTMIRLFGCGRSVSAHIERKKQTGLPIDSLPHRRTNQESGKYGKPNNNAASPCYYRIHHSGRGKGRFDLKRLPEDASETVRVVKVGDYDECLCIGTHVANTSEIGTFKIISHDWDGENKRWRIRFKLV